MNREEIFVALFDKLDARRVAGDLVTCARRLRHIEEMQPGELPAAFQVQGEQVANSRPGMPTVWTLHGEWWVYASNNDPAGAPSSTLNGLLDALCGALDPESPLALQTLSGTTYNASVAGTVELFEGTMGDRAMAVIPIKIVRAN